MTSVILFLENTSVVVQKIGYFFAVRVDTGCENNHVVPLADDFQKLIDVRSFENVKFDRMFLNNDL